MRLLVVSLLFAGFATAQVDGRTKAQLLRRPYTTVAGTAEKERDYFIYLPQGYDTEKGRLWPVLLFLHGGGERGNGKSDLEKVLKHGPLMEAWTKGRDLPFIILSPQLYTNADPVPLPASARTRTTPPISRTPSDIASPWGPEGPPLGWWTVEKDLLAMVDSTLKEFGSGSV